MNLPSVALFHYLHCRLTTGYSASSGGKLADIRSRVVWDHAIKAIFVNKKATWSPSKRLPIQLIVKIGLNHLSILLLRLLFGRACKFPYGSSGFDFGGVGEARRCSAIMRSVTSVISVRLPRRSTATITRSTCSRASAAAATTPSRLSGAQPRTRR